MSTKLCIKIDKALATVTTAPDGSELIDWVPALRAVALEVQALNQLSGTVTFPRAISCNPDAVVWDTKLDPPGYAGSIEGFIGGVNSIPASDGMCTIIVEEYEWLDLGFLPAGVTPQTFTFVLGQPPQAALIP